MGHQHFPPRFAHALVALLTIFCLGLIVRSAATVWKNYCSEGNAAALGACLSPLDDWVPLGISLGFAAIGLGVWIASRRRLSPIFFLLVSATLAAGLPTGWTGADDFSIRLFYLLLAWLAPIAFQFHLGLLGRPLRPVEKVLLGTLYLLAGGASLPLLFSTSGAATQQDWFPVWRIGIRIGLAASFILAWTRLSREYRTRASPVTRGHIRLVIFGTFIGFAPLLFLSLLPETLRLPAYVPYGLTFPWLLLAPLAYVYTLFRSRLTRAELAVNRATIYYLLVVSLFALYLLATAVLNRFLPASANDSVLRNAVLTIALVFLFAPLKRGVERLINWILYGGEIDYVAMVQRLAQALSLTLDRETLRRLILEEWVPAMRLARCLLLLRDQDQDLLYLGSTGLEGVEGIHLSAGGTLATYLKAIDEPVPDDEVRQAMQDRSLDGDEQNVLSLQSIAYWLPLISARDLQGLLLVGPKVGADFFTPEDERILATVAYQAGVAAHNVRLTEELRASKGELALAHQQLLIGREQERQRLAHELHDGAVQRLLGISYQMRLARPPTNLAAGRDPSGSSDGAWSALVREVLGVVSQLRGVIGELRPAGLYELGLVAALEGHVATLRREGALGTLEVALDLAPDDDRLPEPVAICLFRAAQEGLRNTLKHAQARRFEIHLHFETDQVELEWCDDGCGFRVPTRLSELAGAGHYGLVSMAERVTAVGGQMAVHSNPNAGTRVSLRVPLERKEEGNGKQDSGPARG